MAAALLLVRYHAQHDMTYFKPASLAGVRAAARLWLDMAGTMAVAINTKTLAIEPEILDWAAELDEQRSSRSALTIRVR